MRADLAKHLIHFTKGRDREDAYQTLKLILQQRRLLGSARLVRGSIPCVCFSEAPLTSLEHGLINLKSFIFGRGGRAVIYQPEEEFGLLPEALRWRHGRFEPTGDSPIDFTWEREWRLPVDKLRFQFDDVEVVLPDKAFRDRFIAEAESESFHTAWAYTQVLGEIAWAYDTGNPWRTVPLQKI